MGVKMDGDTTASHETAHNNDHGLNDPMKPQQQESVEPNVYQAPNTPIFNQQPSPITTQPDPIWTPTAETKRGFWRRSFAYLPEYFVMLVLLITVVSSITSLIGIGVDSLVKSEKASSLSSFSSYSENFSSFELVASLSALVIALPLFILLFIRTKTIETESPGVRNHRWRKGFLGTFLVVEGLTVIWTLTSIAFDLIGRLISTDSGLFSLFSGGAKDPWWQTVIVGIINVAVLLYVIFVVSRDYRQSQEA
jgi:hypothetical protein